MAASSSRLLKLTLSSYFLRSCRLASSYLLPTASRCHPGPLHSLRFCSAVPAVVDVAADPAEAAVSAGHPWPEWGDFLDKLRAKGYFEQGVPSSSVSSGEGAAGDGDAAVAAASENAAASASGNTVVSVADSAVASVDIYPFWDENRVKNACLKFARDRFDLLSSLPKQDIQAIVMSGCPNKNRKPINSAKRLREFVMVKEEDACSICNFKASCDKAYITPKDKAEVKTVDVVRILLSYAMDKNLSGENSVIESVQESAKKLLSRLIELSDTAIDESLPKPSFQASRKSQGSDGKGRETTAVEMKKGDWLCTNCNFLNFARNRHCKECKADGPKKIEAAMAEMKMGDWICTQCQFMNFSHNKICFKCEEPRPKRQLNPGEWECSSCDFVNFRRNIFCKKCNRDRPEDDTQDSQLGLRKTRGADKSRRFDYIDQKSDDDNVSPYEGFHKRGASMRLKPDQRRTIAKSRGFDDLEDGLVTAKRRSTKEDEDDEVLPYEGVRKHVVSRRAGLVQVVESYRL
ncbi:uncharacterized protein [Miscanthus floridulus]|uniref:uncharacterized protein n=1 Tax=Miscanthus floridulus TaxID=154761 RepID=UPI003458BA48